MTSQVNLHLDHLDIVLGRSGLVLLLFGAVFRLSLGGVGLASLLSTRLLFEVFSLASLLSTRLLFEVLSLAAHWLGVQYGTVNCPVALLGLGAHDEGVGRDEGGHHRAGVGGAVHQAAALQGHRHPPSCPAAPPQVHNTESDRLTLVAEEISRYKIQKKMRPALHIG